MNTYTMLAGGRFISRHDGGVEVYFDSRHRVIKTPMSDGSICELVQERQLDGSYRNQFLSFNTQGERTVVECGR